jgi:hypothetical protein
VFVQLLLLSVCGLCCWVWVKFLLLGVCGFVLLGGGGVLGIFRILCFLLLWYLSLHTSFEGRRGFVEEVGLGWCRNGHRDKSLPIF